MVYMKKENTVGRIGEKLFIDLLRKNKQDWIDLRNSKVVRTIEIGGMFKRSYQTNYYSHPFDFIVNGKNIEIKTSRILGGKIMIGWNKNDIEKIDLIVCVILKRNKENIRAYRV